MFTKFLKTTPLFLESLFPYIPMILQRAVNVVVKGSVSMPEPRYLLDISVIHLDDPPESHWPAPTERPQFEC
jgi:hypothetical protein